MRYATGLLVVLVYSGAFAGQPESRTLTFEERVKAQAAIERVYYSRQIGATKSFEKAVPRAVLESKVHKYLDQTAALAVYWKTAVTDGMLQREFERMARGSQLPDRLAELFTALGNDSFVIKECLARAVLVDRLVRSFHAFDTKLHSGARAQAESIRRELEAKVLDPHEKRPDRFVVESVACNGQPNGRGMAGRPDVVRDQRRRCLSAEELARLRTELPLLPGVPGRVEEQEKAFAIRVMLSDAAEHLTVATYIVPKGDYAAWWRSAKRSISGDLVTAVATDYAAVPSIQSSADAGPCPSNDVWDNGILDDTPEGRWRYSTVWTGTEMIVWGGMGYGGVLRSGGRYDPATDTWSSVSMTGAPSPRYDHAAVWTGSQLLVWGGIGDDWQNTGGRYDPTTDTWMPIAMEGAPASRSGHTAIWTGFEMLVWGGYGNGGDLNTGGRYDPATNTWCPMGGTGAPSARYFHAAVWTGLEMIVWGGDNYLNTGGRYDPATDTWRPTSTLDAPSGRYPESVVWTGSEMIIWGGWAATGVEENTGGRYDPATDTWIATSMVGTPSARSAHRMVWTGSEMVVWGGYSAGYPSTGGRYDPATNTWRPTSTAGAPLGRHSHSAVWTGSEIVVWGGFPGENTGGRYDPRTDSWTPTSVNAAPSSRSGHTTVWTGSEMLVWGGYSYLGAPLNDGGGYDPALDAWRSISVQGAPTARSRHTGVWTGNHMVVWGGLDWQGQPQNTGGRYDPASDVWFSTSIMGAPSGRSGHSAVSTGSEMLVWGGMDGLGFPNTGGKYDPSFDMWLPTSIIGAPSGRYFHTAVWTGREMLVWGGADGFGVSNSGGRYDPATDSWSPISMAASPLARCSHTAVWTGSEMVVWGGEGPPWTSTPPLNTGGRYDPTVDSWTPTSMNRAPSARFAHVAIWTGNVMVVWGGSYSSDGSGGRYDPERDRWVPTSTSGSPTSGDTAVWSGNAMIVWNGHAGGRYLLASDPSLSCDDGDACTDDSCGPMGCSHVPVQCEDWNACTTDNCDAGIGCVSTPHPGSACDDQNWCTTNDVCDGNGACIGVSVVCDDGNPCTTDSCDAGACAHPPLPAGTSCGSGNDTVCDDPDTCDGTGNCLTNHAPDGTACDDGNACTAGDGCFNGVCERLNYSSMIGTENRVACGVRNDGRLRCWGASGWGHVAGSNASTDLFKAVSVGSYHLCALRADDRAFCWGSDQSGSVAGPNSSNGTFQAVEAGYYHTCGLHADGRLECWGQDGYGQVSGPNASTDVYIALAPGANHTCALKAGGRVTCWGWDNYEQTSGPNASNERYTAISADAWHTCALGLEGRLRCWGADVGGAVSGPNGDSRTYKAVSTGYYHTCALGWDGRLTCWGIDGNGQVSGPNASTATYKAVRAGYYLTCALRDTGRLQCWGFDDSGQVSGPNGSSELFGFALCDDADRCTDDVCDPAVGCSHGPLSCDDANPCTSDSCNSATGCVFTPAPGRTCDDGDSCTTQDACDATSACVGGSPLNCDDANPCTEDSCEPSAGCRHTPIQTGQTTCGIGACQRTVDNCLDEVPQVCVPRAPAPEACNGEDDDCDGVTDNGAPSGIGSVSFTSDLTNVVMSVNSTSTTFVGFTNAGASPACLVTARFDAAFQHPTMTLTGTVPSIVAPGGAGALTIEIGSADTLPGLYSGTLTVVGSDGVESSTRLDIRVAPTGLPDLTPVSPTGGVTIVGEHGPSPLDIGEPFTISTTVRNIGLAAAGSHRVHFLANGNLLGLVERPAGLQPGAFEDVALAVSGDALAEDMYFVVVEVESLEGEEIDTTNNSASAALQVGHPPVSIPIIEVVASASLGCGDGTLQVTGTASYAFALPGGGILKHPVKGAAVTAQVRGPGGETLAVFPAARTDTSGRFTQVIRAPAVSPLVVDVQVTDATLVGSDSSSIEACEIGGVDPPPGATDVDLSLCREGVEFRRADCLTPWSGPVSVGDTICLRVNVWNLGNGPVWSQRVDFVAHVREGAGFRSEPIGSRIVGFRGYGTSSATQRWTVPAEGQHVVEARIVSTIEQPEDNDVRTRAITVGSGSPGTVVSVTTAVAGCDFRVMVAGEASYRPDADGAESVPVACGVETLTVAECELGEQLTSTSYTDPQGGYVDGIAGLASCDRNIHVAVADGTLTGVALSRLVCTGGGGGGGAGPDVFLSFQDVGVFTDATCSTPLLRRPEPNETVGLGATIHYVGTDPLTDGQPVTMTVFAPSASGPQPEPLGTDFVTFPGGTGTDRACLAWTLRTRGKHVASVAVVPTIVQPTGNDRTTHDFEVGSSPCVLRVDPAVVHVTSERGATLAVNGSGGDVTTAPFSLVVTSIPPDPLPSGFGSAFNPGSPLSPPFETLLSVAVNATTPVGSYPLLITGTAGGCNANASFSLMVDPLVCVDADGDGYGVSGLAVCPAGPQRDCNDTNPDVHPNAPELCNGIDDDCDGAFDEDASGSVLALSFPDPVTYASVAPGEQVQVPVHLSNPGPADVRVASALILAEFSHPALSVTTGTPFTLCAGASRDVVLLVNASNTGGGLYSALLKLRGTDGAEVATEVEIEVLTTAGLPDLEVRSSEVSVTGATGPTPLDVGEAYDVLARVRNVGTAPAEPFHVRLFADGDEVASADVSTMTAVGAYVGVPMSVATGFVTNGWHSLRVQAGPLPGGEVRTSNNVATVTVRVGDVVPGSAWVQVSASAATTCSADLAQVRGQALRRSLVDGVRPVAGGPVAATLWDSTGTTLVATFPAATTRADGTFDVSAAAPPEGSYLVRVTVTDGELSGNAETTLGGCTVAIGPPGSGPPDLAVCSDEIEFLDAGCESVLTADPLPGQTVCIRATVHKDGAGEALGQWVAFDAHVRQGSGFETVPIDRRLVSISGVASAVLTSFWAVPSDGEHVVEVRIEPDIVQRTSNDVATLGIRVGSGSPATPVTIAATASGCGSHVRASGRADYGTRSGDPDSSLPVGCGAVAMTLFDATRPGIPLESVSGLRTDAMGNLAAGLASTLVPGQYVARIEVADGTLAGAIDIPITCAGADRPGPADVSLFSEDIGYYADPACQTPLVGNPNSGEPMGIAVSVHYSGADPLLNQPLTVGQILPIAGAIRKFVILNTTVSFPDGSGTETLCVPFTPPTDGGRVIEATVSPTISQPTWNDSATRELTAGPISCQLALDHNIVSPMPGVPAVVHVSGSDTGFLTDFFALSVQPSEGDVLPGDIAFSFDPDVPQSAPFESALTVSVDASATAERRRLFVVAEGERCITLAELSVIPACLTPGDQTDCPIRLSVVAQPAIYREVGQRITYRYRLENAGLGFVSGPIQVNDDRLGATGCSTAGLDSLGVVTCARTYTVTQADLDAGSMTNVATATSGGTVVAHATVTAYAPWALLPIQYAALGDSYSAGQGNPDYVDCTDCPGKNCTAASCPPLPLPECTELGPYKDECHRSRDDAYSGLIRAPGRTESIQFLQDAGNPGFSRDFAACSGAVTSNLFGANPSYPCTPDWYPQADREPDVLTTGTDLVTVTIGGNDADFVRIVKFCAFHLHCEQSRKFEPRWPGTLGEWLPQQIRRVVQPRLVSVYQRIKEQSGNSGVFVLGYPRLVGFGGTCPELPPEFPPVPLFDRGEREFFRTNTDNLNRAIRRAAEEVGVHQLAWREPGEGYPDEQLPTIADHFDGKEACNGRRYGDEWVIGVRIPAFEESFHPNEDGQKEYAAVLNDYVRETIEGGWPYGMLSTGVPKNPPPPSSYSFSRALAAPESEPSLPTFGDLEIDPAEASPCPGRTVVVPGEAVRVRGGGFAPAEMVYVSLATPDLERQIESLQADSEGNIDGVVSIPQDASPSDVAGLEAFGAGANGMGRIALGSLRIGPPLDVDADSDGVSDACDDCPSAPDPDQTDSDEDGAGDACDACPQDRNDDADGDGLCADQDPCPADPDNDVDGDGVCGDVDNCPLDPNPDQADANANGRGDACEAIPCHSLSFSVSPGTGGSVVPSPSNCGLDDYQDGTMVAVAASPAPGFTFLGWAGAANVGTANPLEFSIHATTSLVAVFGDDSGDADGDGTPNSLDCDPLNAAVGSCDDGSVCTVDACADRQCVHTPVVCVDDNPCTDDSCNAVSGCVFVPDGTKACSGPDPCRPGSCVAGACQIGPSNDLDGDGVCSPPDNCPDVVNPDQADADTDGHGDACDCAPGDAGAFALVPELALTVQRAGPTLSWPDLASSCGTGTVYDLVRGKLREFPVGTGPSEMCLQSAGAGASLSDLEVPPLGSGYWYLLRGRNACGLGSYGNLSSGAPRQSPTCP